MSNVQVVNPKHVTCIAASNKDDNLFVDDNHLQIQICNADIVDDAHVWIERENDNTTDGDECFSDNAKDYQLLTSDTENVEQLSYTIIIDGGNFNDSEGVESKRVIICEDLLEMQTSDETTETDEDDTKTDEEKNVGINNGTVNDNIVKKIVVSKDSHTILLNYDNLKFYNLYKYGQFKQTKNDNTVLDGVKDENVSGISSYSATWMENKTVIEPNIYVEIEPKETDWVIFNDPNGNSLNIEENNSEKTRTCYLKYYIAFGEDNTNDAKLFATIELTQNHAKNIQLTFNVKSNDEQLALPLTLYYTNYNVTNELWDNIVKLNTDSSTLSFDREYEINSVDIYPNNDSIGEFSDNLGLSTNTFGYTAFEMIATNEESEDQINLNKVGEAHKHNTSAPIFTIEIQPIGEKRVGLQIDDTNPLMYTEFQYIDCEGFSSCYVVYKTSFKDKSDTSLWDGDEILLKELETVISQELNTLNVNDVFIGVPLAYEKVGESTFFDFTIDNLQEASNTYSLLYDGFTLDETNNFLDGQGSTTPETQSKHILIQEELEVEKPDGNGTVIDVFYKALESTINNFEIIADFTASTSETSKCKITYSPLIANYGCACNYTDNSQDVEGINKTVLFTNKKIEYDSEDGSSLDNKKTVYYSIDKYDLQIETNEIVKGEKIGGVKGNVFTEYQPKEVTVEYYLNTLSLDGELETKLVTLQIKYEPNILVGKWNGYHKGDELPIF